MYFISQELSVKKIVIMGEIGEERERVRERERGGEREGGREERAVKELLLKRYTHLSQSLIGSSWVMGMAVTEAILRL